MTFLSFLASIAILSVAIITFFIIFLNYRAVVSFSLYIEAKTMRSISYQKGSYSPDRINKTLSLNHITSQYVSLTYFDIYLGNTGPGLVKNIKWKVDYYPDGTCNDLNMTKGEIKAFGPQAKKNIVGYLVRDIISPKTNNLKLPNKNGKFPWVISIEYDKPGIHFRKTRKENFEISQDGSVEQVSK